MQTTGIGLNQFGFRSAVLCLLLQVLCIVISSFSAHELEIEIHSLFCAHPRSCHAIVLLEFFFCGADLVFQTSLQSGFLYIPNSQGTFFL